MKWDKKFEEELSKFFAKAFHEVVLPVLEDTNGKIGSLDKRLTSVKQNMATKDDMDRIERRLVRMDDQLDRYGNRIDNHEKRIVKFETGHPTPWVIC